MTSLFAVVLSHYDSITFKTFATLSLYFTDQTREVVKMLISLIAHLFINPF